jgi:hypothetical protein
MMPMLKGVPPLEYWFSLRKFKRLIKRIVLTAVGLRLTADKVEKASPEDKYKAFFTSPTIFSVSFRIRYILSRSLPMWSTTRKKTHNLLVSSFLNGVNPLMIERVRKLDNQVTAELRASLQDKFDLKQLTDEKRIFVLDYKWLANFKVNPHQALPEPMNDVPQNNPRYFQAPQVFLKLDEDRQNLKCLSHTIGAKARVQGVLS